jgi:ankyrin repeat protein
MNAANAGDLYTIQHLQNNIDEMGTAIDHNKCRLVKHLLERKADPNKRSIFVDSNGTMLLSPLARAAKQGHISIIEYLLQTGAVDINRDEGIHYNALAQACIEGKLESLKTLVREGADVNKPCERFQPDDGYTILACAVRSGQIEIMKFLIDQGARYFGDAVFVAIKHKKTDILRWLVSTQHHLIHNQHIWGGGTLDFAANEGDLDIVKILLGAGLNADAPDFMGETPLFACTRGDRLCVATYLIDECGVNVNHVSHNGNTPLHTAIENGELEIIQMLVKRNARVDVVNRDDMTPLDIAAQAEYFDIGLFLISQGAQIRKQSQPMLYTAIHNGNINVIKLLEDVGIGLDTPDEYEGQTPLFNCIGGTNSVDVATYLIEKGANVNHTTEHGKTPLHDAVEHGEFGLVQLLVERNARVNMVNDGYTPLDIALECNRLEVCLYLLSHGAQTKAEKLTRNIEIIFSKWNPVSYQQEMYRMRQAMPDNITSVVNDIIWQYAQPTLFELMMGLNFVELDVYL